MAVELPKVKAAETALLVMDFQVGIIGMLADAEDLLGRVEKAIAWAREHGVTVGYVRVAFEGSDVEKVPDTNKGFSQIVGERAAQMHADAPGTQVHEQLKPQDGDIIVRKVRVGAFSTTDLDEQLKEKGIRNIILAGISTSGVVLSTTRDADDKDYRVFILADGVADTDEETHRVLVEKVFPRQAHVINVADLADLLSTN